MHNLVTIQTMKPLTKHLRNLLTPKNQKDQGEATNTIIGTVIVLLSGIILYADKIINYFDLQIDYEFKYYVELEVFVWTVAGTVAPLLLIIGYFLKPYRWALAAPLTAYSVQIMYIWRDEKWIQRDYFWHHTVAFMVGFVVLVYILKNYKSTISKLKEKMRFVMDRIILDGPDHAKDPDKWEEEIVEPTLDKLNE